MDDFIRKCWREADKRGLDLAAHTEQVAYLISRWEQGLITWEDYLDGMDHLRRVVPKRIVPKNRTTIRRQLDHILQTTG